MQRHDAHDAGEATATGPSDAPAADHDVPVRFGDGDEHVTPMGLARIVRVDMVLTAVFVVSAVFAAIVFNGPARVIGVVVALALFAIGTFAFLMGYFVAIGRSRTQEIAVAELYLLAGKALPSAPKRALLWLLGVQVVTALATALARPNTDGRAGSTLAFGVLVPMLGLGLNGLASARHGVFGARRRRGEPATGDADDDSGGDDAADTTGAAARGDAVPPANGDLD